jgi:hypothetical protein
VRVRPADDGEHALVIEPTVTGQHSERPVELSGAGIQEAVVLSTLLRGLPARITVLDEPAVNLGRRFSAGWSGKSAEIRSLLFAQAAVLCEGQTGSAR